MNPSLIQKIFFLPTRCAILQGAKIGEIEILHENENLTILLTMAWRLDGRRGGGLKKWGEALEPDPRADIAHKTSSEQEIFNF